MKENFPTYQSFEEDVSPEVKLPGAGSYEVVLLRHSAFDKTKIPQLVDSDGNILGDAEIHEGSSKNEGYFGPTGEEAENLALTIPGLSTEEAIEMTRNEGAQLGELLKSDGVPTYVKVVASPTRWPNERLAEKNINHLFGSRTISTAVSFVEGLQSVADENIRIDEQIETDERLREAGYFYIEEEGRLYDVISVVAKAHAKMDGHEGNPNEYFIRNHPLMEVLAQDFGTRTAKEISYDIDEMVNEYEEATEELRKEGVRVVVVGVTHAQDMKSFMLHQVGSEKGAFQKQGYRDSEMIVLEKTDDQHNPYKPLAYSDLK